jgi:amino acid adenylation domain-containing protein
VALGLNLAQAFYRRALVEPGRPALWVDGSTYTYRRLAVAATAVAAGLRARGVGPGSRVGLLAGRSVVAYAGVLGTAWTGAVYVPLGLTDPSARLTRIVERADLEAIVVDRQGSDRLAELDGIQSTSILPAEDAVAENSESRRLPAPQPLDALDLAYLFFTSGSTGVPKGVPVTAGAIQHFLDCVRRRYQLRSDDRVAHLAKRTFDGSLSELFAAWDAGASVYVAPELERLAPDEFVNRHRLTVWDSVPSTGLLLAEFGRLLPNNLPSLRLTLFGGESLPAALVTAWRKAAPKSRIENLYGPTEATVACLAQACSSPLPLTRGRDTVAIGKPFRGTRARVVGSDAALELEAGRAGELALAGPQLAAGYWRDETLTRRRFINLTESDEERTWFLTGDRVYRDDEGRFHFLGRLDHQVKVNGARVELEEIESLLRSSCGCREAAAVAWPVRAGSARGIVAFVAGGRLTCAEARRELAKHLPAYHVPGRIIRLESLPLSPNGKIDREPLLHSLGR